MKIAKEITNLSEFEAWRGATDNWQKIIDAGKGEAFITALEEFYPDGIDEIALNDLLWFEDEFVLHLVGLKTDDEEEDENDPQHIADENGWEILEVPEWALCYIVYGDPGDLTDEDILQIEAWERTHKFIEPVTDLRTGEQQEAYFSLYPEFGKPCNVKECFCEEIEDEELEGETC